MHSKSDSIKVMIYEKADEVMKELFQSLLNRYQIGWETAMISSDFIFMLICGIINFIKEI